LLYSEWGDVTVVGLVWAGVAVCVCGVGEVEPVPAAVLRGRTTDGSHGHGSRPAAPGVTFSQHSVTIQSTFSQHLINIQSTFSQHSVNIQSTFSQHSVNIQSTFSQHSVNIQSTFSQHLVNIQSTFNQHSVNFQSTFSQLSVNIPHRASYLLMKADFIYHSPLTLTPVLT
jgi:hypothetical protein